MVLGIKGEADELGQRLSRWGTVFQGELIGIQLAADWLLQSGPYRGEEVNFYIDSSSTIKLLFADKVNAKTQLRAIELMDKVAKDRTTTINWIKSHQGHSGNHCVNETAKAVYQGLRQEPFGRRLVDESDLHKVKVTNIHKLMQQSCLRKLEIDENMPELFFNDEYLSQRPKLELVEDTDKEMSDSGLNRVHVQGQGDRKR